VIETHFYSSREGEGKFYGTEITEQKGLAIRVRGEHLKGRGNSPPLGAGEERKEEGRETLEAL